MPTDAPAIDPRRKRLIFRSWHRGTKEMDLLMGSFADMHLPALTEAEVDAYEALLLEQDPDVYDWILGRAEVPPAHDTRVMALLRDHRYAGAPTRA